MLALYLCLFLLNHLNLCVINHQTTCLWNNIYLRPTMVSITWMVCLNCFSCLQCLDYIVRVSHSRWTSSWMWTFRSTPLISVKLLIFLCSKHSKFTKVVNQHLSNMFQLFVFGLSIHVRWQVQTGYCQHVVRRWDARRWRVQSPRWPTIPVKHFLSFLCKVCELRRCNHGWYWSLV